jgi:diguanylate cyclase (GGDEF)-like protein
MSVTGSSTSPGQTPPALRQRLREIRASLVDRLWLSLLIVVFVGVPLSLLRTTTTGWLPLYDAHIAIGVLVVCVFLARKRLSTTFKVAAIVVIFWTIGLAGLFATGLIGASLWWLSLSVLLISALYSVRAGMLAALVMLATVALAGAGYVQGWLTLPFDANAYIRTPAAWGSIMVGVVLLPLLVFSTVASFHASTLQLLEELDAQHELVRQLADHDELTGVPTLRLATDRLEQALLGAARSGGRVAVLFIDLDGFKAINDTHGHDAGDAVLKAVAVRCSHIVRADDTIARRGGDEFIAVLKEVAGPPAALALAQRILDALAAPVPYGVESLHVGASIGIALFPEHAATAAGMIRAGDGAMYEAKRSGTNQVRMAQPLPPQASA